MSPEHKRPAYVLSPAEAREIEKELERVRTLCNVARWRLIFRPAAENKHNN